jgi:RNA polymerase sigma factor (sigma-70 family)
MSTEHSVTAWIAALKGGDQSAADALVRRYFDKLVGVGRGVYRRDFNDVPRPAEDEEDAALSAFKSFWAHAENFDRLTDRNDLWKLLVTITIRKVYRQRRRAMTAKRGGGNVQTHAPEELDKFVEELPAAEAAAEFEDALRAAMAALNPDLKPVAQMLLDDKTAPEIANELGVTERTVYRRKQAIAEIWDEYFATGD